MGLSRLAKKCKECRFVDTCENKRMEALAYLDDKKLIADASEKTAMSAAAPMLRETMKIHIDGHDVLVYKDEIERELYKHLGVDLMRGGC